MCHIFLFCHDNLLGSLIHPLPILYMRAPEFRSTVSLDYLKKPASNFIIFVLVAMNTFFT